MDDEWIDVEDQEMDCGILLDLEGHAARCVAMTHVRKGDPIVVGRQGLRVFPADLAARQSLFEFMASPVSSEKPKGVTVREIAAAMRRSRAAGEKILAVLGPAVVHTGSVEHICALIRMGFLNVLFAGNALATHDIEQAFFGTSLGINLERGLPAWGRSKRYVSEERREAPGRRERSLPAQEGRQAGGGRVAPAHGHARGQATLQAAWRNRPHVPSRPRSDDSFHKAIK